MTVVGGDEFDLEAFDAADASLGSVHLLTDLSDVEVSEQFGNLPISRFSIETNADGQDGQQLGWVTFQVPEPCAGASTLAALASAAALGLRARGAAGSVPRSEHPPRAGRPRRAGDRDRWPRVGV